MVAVAIGLHEDVAGKKIFKDQVNFPFFLKQLLLAIAISL